MKPTFFLLAASALTTLDFTAHAQNAPLTATQILEKSRATYAAFGVYQGDCSVVSDAEFEVEGQAPAHELSGASAHIEFERGAQLSIRGFDSEGLPFRAFSSPKETWLETTETAADAGQFPPRNKAERHNYKDDDVLSAREAMLGGATGVTHGAASTIPAALLGQIWSSPFPSPKTNAELRESVKLGDAKCYVVVASSPALNSVRTYWIEENTFLLRRLQDEQGAATYDDMPEIDGKKQAVTKLKYAFYTYVFATSKAE